MLKYFLLLLSGVVFSFQSNATDGIVRLNGEFVEGGCEVSAQVIEIGHISPITDTEFPLRMDECHDIVLSNLVISIDGEKEKTPEGEVFSLSHVSNGRKLNGVGIALTSNGYVPIIPGKAIIQSPEHDGSYDIRIKYVVTNGNFHEKGTSSLQWLMLTYF